MIGIKISYLILSYLVDVNREVKFFCEISKKKKRGGGGGGGGGVRVDVNQEVKFL